MLKALDENGPALPVETTGERVTLTIGVPTGRAYLADLGARPFGPGRSWVHTAVNQRRCFQRHPTRGQPGPQAQAFAAEARQASADLLLLSERWLHGYELERTVPVDIKD